jgi:hypothetical protein
MNLVGRITIRSPQLQSKGSWNHLLQELIPNQIKPVVKKKKIGNEDYFY